MHLAQCFKSGFHNASYANTAYADAYLTANGYGLRYGYAYSGWDRARASYECANMDRTVQADLVVQLMRALTVLLVVYALTMLALTLYELAP